MNINIYKYLSSDNSIKFEKCWVCRELHIPWQKNHICNGDTEISCEYCGLLFTSTSALVEHLTIHTENKFYKCTRCPRIFAMGTLLKFHTSKCHRVIEPNFVCDICSEKFHSHYEIKNHVEEMHKGPLPENKQRPFQCGTCGKCFSDVSKLKMHRTIKHDKVQTHRFECYLCKLELKSSYYTREHMKMHPRDYKCAVCTTSFTSLELEDHMCPGLKVVKCSYCQQPFDIMKDLLEHLEQCTNETFVYKCDMCKKYFRMEFLRDFHLKHHDEEPLKQFLCDLCPKRFANQILLNSHKQRHNASLG